MLSHAKSQLAYTGEQLISAPSLYFIDGLPQAQIGKLVTSIKAFGRTLRSLTIFKSTFRPRR